MAACSGGSEREGDGASVELPPAVPVECRPEMSSSVDVEGPTTTMSDRCLDAFVEATVASIEGELGDLDADVVNGFIRGTCAFGEALASGDAMVTTRSDFLESNASSWGVSVESVETVLNLAIAACPDAVATVRSLPDEVQRREFTLVARARGEANLVFTLPDGTATEETFEDEMVHSVVYDAPIAIVVQVFGTDGLECEISANGVVLSEGDDLLTPGSAVCEVSEETARGVEPLP